MPGTVRPRTNEVAARLRGGTRRAGKLRHVTLAICQGETRTGRDGKQYPAREWGGPDRQNTQQNRGEAGPPVFLSRLQPRCNLVAVALSRFAYLLGIMVPRPRLELGTP